MILKYIFNNKMLNDAITNVVDDKYRDDFKAHFHLQVAEFSEIKLTDLYNRRVIDWVCLKIITNQWKSTSSSFYKIYRNGGFAGDKIVRLESEFINNDDEDRLEKVADDDEYIEPIDDKEVIEEMKLLLDYQYEDFLVNQYHKTLFEMYYFDDLTLKEIEKLTDIDFNAISRSVRRTKTYLKTKIKI